MIYPTNLLRAFAVVCSWRILKAKINFSFLYSKLEKRKQASYTNIFAY